jgi:TRAP-type uncharacterized transport system substrate-binding protein
MDAKGWSMDDFALASELKAAEQAGALGDNKIDAMIYTVGHPAGSIQEATTTCDMPSSFRSVGPKSTSWFRDNPFYAKAVHSRRHVQGQ